jgi:ferritin-like metal-binding protein YciE
MPSDIHDLLTTALQDIYSGENQLLVALPKMQEAASTASLKKAFKDHLKQTEKQVERLGKVCKMLEIDAEGETCEAMEGLVEEADELVDELDEGPVLDAGLIGAAQKVEHYEIASYGTLISLLQAMGEDKSAALLVQTLDEEKAADSLLTEIAETEVVPSALSSREAAEVDADSEE